MNAEEKSMLIAFSDAKTSLSAVDYGIWLAGQIKLSVTLLGIVEKSARRKRVEEIMASAVEHIQAKGIPYQTKLISGPCRKVISQQSFTDRNLTVFGSFDRPLLKRWLRGRSFRRIVGEIQTPVLYVNHTHLQMRKILVCLGGLGYAKSAEYWALSLAQRMNASVTLLHVVEPISYQYPIAKAIQDHREDILDTTTPQGQNLRQALRIAKDMEVETNFKVRFGDIVHEIIVEVQTQSYDLIVMGSPYSTSNLRHLFLPNVTAEIAESVSCPVLVVAFGQQPIFQ